MCASVWGAYHLAPPVHHVPRSVHRPPALRVAVSLDASRGRSRRLISDPWRPEFGAVRGPLPYFPYSSLSFGVRTGSAELGGCADGSVTKRLLSRHGAEGTQERIWSWNGGYVLRISLTSWRREKKRMSARGHPTAPTLLPIPGSATAYHTCLCPPRDGSVWPTVPLLLSSRLVLIDALDRGAQQPFCYASSIEHRQVLRGGEPSADVRLFHVPHPS